MPLRKWMVSHGLPSWYSWVAVVLTCVTASVLSLMVSLSLNQRAIERERSARVAAESAFCALIAVLDDAYRRNPPPSPTGKEVARAVVRMRVAYRCPPSTVPTKK